MGKTFADVSTAAEFRDLVARIADGRINKLRPAARIAEVIEVNKEQLIAKVKFAGDEGSFNARFGKSLIPRDIGAIVRIIGNPGNYYITEILNGSGEHADYEPIIPIIDVVIPDLQGNLDELNTVTLPGLQASLNNLNNVTIPNLQTNLNTLNNVTIPNLQTNLNTLNNVTIPGLNSQLSTLDSDLALLEGKFPITSVSISNDAITAPKIFAGAVIAGKISADAVTANTIAAGAIIAGKIATDAVTANNIQAGAITAIKLAADSVTANTIAAGAVTASEIAANAVTANAILAGSIVAGKIATDAVTANTIQAGAIVAGKIAADAVTATQIAADAISAKHTITGATIRTAASGDRVTLTGEAGRGFLRFYDSAGNLNGGINSNDSPRRMTLNGPGAGKIFLDSGNVEINNATLSITGGGGATIGGGVTISSGGLTVGGQNQLNSLADGGANNQSQGPKYVRAGASGVLWASTTAPSSRRIKHDIQILNFNWHQMMKMKAYTYRYNEDPDNVRAGFMAEDAHKLGLGLWVGYEDRKHPKRPTGFDYDGYVAGLHMVCQNLYREINDLKKVVATLTPKT